MIMMDFETWAETNDDELWEEFKTDGWAPHEWEPFLDYKYDEYYLEELLTESMVDHAQDDADEHPWVNR